MRLAEFILRDMEPILVEWEAFAATLFSAAVKAGPLLLRDHAQQILEAVAKDLSTPQTRLVQSEKSKGRGHRLMDAPETAAETHATMRARSGFNINQLAAEYRALRASVLRQWMDASRLDELDMEDMVRFNEAIDQAIGESVAFFSTQVERSRNLLLGMLGHDMRSPLNTIQMTAIHLAALNAGDDVSEAASRLIRSGASMKALLDDLVDFSRTSLGVGIHISPADVDLAAVLADEMEQLRGAYPGRQIESQVTGDTRGRWDSVRLQQLIRNLVSNALQYGAPDAPVLVLVKGGKADVRVEVVNKGEILDASVVHEIFNPLKRGPAQQAQGTDGGLGLGLFIVNQIALAHGGEVAVRSEGGKTMFAARLPRSPAAGTP